MYAHLGASNGVLPDFYFLFLQDKEINKKSLDKNLWTNILCILEQCFKHPLKLILETSYWCMVIFYKDENVDELNCMGAIYVLSVFF